MEKPRAGFPWSGFLKRARCGKNSLAVPHRQVRTRHENKKKVKMFDWRLGGVFAGKQGKVRKGGVEKGSRTWQGEKHGELGKRGNLNNRLPKYNNGILWV